MIIPDKVLTVLTVLFDKSEVQCPLLAGCGAEMSGFRGSQNFLLVILKKGR